MLVGNNKPVSYFSLSKKDNGKLRTKDANKNEHFYDYIQGLLVGIELKEDEFEGRKSNKYYFKFEPENHSQIGFLQIGEDASAARGLLAALLTVPGKEIRQVKVRPYTSSDIYEGEEVTFVNVDVSVRNTDNDPWVRLIEIESTKPIYKKIFEKMPEDLSARREYVKKMASAVIQRLKATAGEYVDEHGEVHATDGAQPAPDGLQNSEAVYGEPGNRPAPHRPVQKEVHNTGADDRSVFDDIDDDLPF